MLCNRCNLFHWVVYVLFSLSKLNYAQAVFAKIIRAFFEPWLYQFDSLQTHWMSHLILSYAKPVISELIQQLLSQVEMECQNGGANSIWQHPNFQLSINSLAFCCPYQWNLDFISKSLSGKESATPMGNVGVLKSFPLYSLGKRWDNYVCQELQYRHKVK